MRGTIPSEGGWVLWHVDMVVSTSGSKRNTRPESLQSKHWGLSPIKEENATRDDGSAGGAAGRTGRQIGEAGFARRCRGPER